MEKETKGLDFDYKLIPMSEITDEARIIAVRWGDEYFPGIALSEKHKLASDIMNYARRHAIQFGKFLQGKEQHLLYEEFLSQLKRKS